METEPKLEGPPAYGKFHIFLEPFFSGRLHDGQTDRTRAIGHFGNIESIRFPDLNIVNLMLIYN